MGNTSNYGAGQSDAWVLSLSELGVSCDTQLGISSVVPVRDDFGSVARWTAHEHDMNDSAATVTEPSSGAAPATATATSQCE